MGYWFGMAEGMPTARLTLGFEYPMYSPTSTEHTDLPFLDRINIVSRYISPDSCKYILRPLMFSDMWICFYSALNILIAYADIILKFLIVVFKLY